jgi:uncharacterized phage-associated protein
MLFNEIKAAQVAAFFLFKGGRRLPVLKLMKLMYLAERASLKKYGETITGDTLVSMRHGPVLSNTYDYISDQCESAPDGWSAWVNDRENHELALAKEFTDAKQALLELSDADIEILEEIWDGYGHYGKFQLRDLTHKICPEWENPGFSSSPIPYSRVLSYLGYSHEKALELEARIFEQRQVERLLSVE